MSRVFVVALLAIVGSYLLYERFSTTSEQAADTTESKGFEFPEADNIVATSLTGTVFDLADHRGEVVLLNFWATWCAPCWEEMPMLVSLQDELRDDGLMIVGISVDEGGPEIVRTYMESFDFNYEILHDDTGIDVKFGAQYAVPTTVIIDKLGKVRHRIVGVIEEADLKPVVKRLLAE